MAHPRQKGVREVEKGRRDVLRQRVDAEVDLSGTGRNEMAYYEGAGLQDDFISALQKFEKGDVPKFTKDDFAMGNSELATVYNAARESLE